MYREESIVAPHCQHFSVLSLPMQYVGISQSSRDRLVLAWKKRPILIIHFRDSAREAGPYAVTRGGERKGSRGSYPLPPPPAPPSQSQSQLELPSARKSTRHFYVPAATRVLTSSTRSFTVFLQSHDFSTKCNDGLPLLFNIQHGLDYHSQRQVASNGLDQLPSLSIPCWTHLPHMSRRIRVRNAICSCFPFRYSTDIDRSIHGQTVSALYGRRSRLWRSPNSADRAVLRSRSSFPSGPILRVTPSMNILSSGGA